MIKKILLMMLCRISNDLHQRNAVNLISHKKKSGIKPLMNIVLISKKLPAFLK